MTQLLQSDSKRVNSSPLDNPWRFLDLLHGASEHLVILTALAVAVTWVPLAVLSALRGGTTFLSFLTDYASQSRFLIILPVLILGAPSLHKRLARVAHHLEDFVPESQLSAFNAGWASFERLRNSTIAKARDGVADLRTCRMAGTIFEPPRGRDCGLVERCRRLWVVLAGRYLGALCQLSDCGLLHPALAVETIALDTIHVGHGAVGPSPHRRPS